MTSEGLWRKRHNMAGHVYLIGSRKYNWYKIGKSSNAAIRVSDLGILLPFRIEVFAVWKAENHHELEKLLHEKYTNHRINGEWFNFGWPTVRSLIASMQQAQVQVASGFSNLPESKQEYRVRLGLDKDFSVRPKHPAEARISELIRFNNELREELKKLLGQTASNLSVQ